MMSTRKPSRREMLSSCAEVGPEDGMDPRDFQRQAAPRVANRKALQLCGQVMRTLHHVLSGECGDEVLRELIVHSVMPAPNTGRLLVTVALAASADTVDSSQVLERLQRAQGLLRSEVAAAISRRRVPELTFRLLTM
jgi:ribosome-binding factor A